MSKLKKDPKKEKVLMVLLRNPKTNKTITVIKAVWDECEAMEGGNPYAKNLWQLITPEKAGLEKVAEKIEPVKDKVTETPPEFLKPANIQNKNDNSKE